MIQIALLPTQLGAEKIDASRESIKYSIAIRIVEAQIACEELYSALNFGETNWEKISAYKMFVSILKGLYISVKHNIRHSRKLSDWDKKETKYENFFATAKDASIENMNTAMTLFDEFSEDLVVSGIYSILKEIRIVDVEYIGEEVEGANTN